MTEYIDLAIKYSDLIKSTLGPNGRNKMVKSGDKLLTTNDGATIMKNVKIENPIGDLFRRLSVSQEELVGDGTTSAIVLAGSLLENAKELINKGLHPSYIIDGYNKAKLATLQILEKLKFEGKKDEIIDTCIGSKISHDMKEEIKKVLHNDLDYANLKIYKRDNSKNGIELISGYGFNGMTRNDRMEPLVKGKMALIDFKVNLKTTEQYSLKDADELERLESKEKTFAKGIVDKLKKAGIECVFYTDTSKEFETYLTEAGISGILLRRRDDIDNISKALNSQAIPDTSVDFHQYTNRAEMEYYKGKVLLRNENSKIQTLVISGQTLQILEEIERTIDDVTKILKHGTEVVVGAGAVEMELAKEISRLEIEGKSQIGFESFSDALESIPMQIVKNAGMDAWGLLTELRVQHKNNPNIGVDIKSKTGYSDAKERGIVEPKLIKSYAIASAVDVVNLILKLDSILVGEGENEQNEKNNK